MRSSVSFVSGVARAGAFVTSRSGVPRIEGDDWSRGRSPSARGDGLCAALGDWNTRAVPVDGGVSSYRLLCPIARDESRARGFERVALCGRARR